MTEQDFWKRCMTWWVIVCVSVVVLNAVFGWSIRYQAGQWKTVLIEHRVLRDHLTAETNRIITSINALTVGMNAFDNVLSRSNKIWQAEFKQLRLMLGPEPAFRTEVFQRFKDIDARAEQFEKSLDARDRPAQ